MDRFGEVYRTHERTVLRACMTRVRSPELAADLTAETFAVALASEPDEPHEAWLLRLAEAQLLRAYRTGVVDDSARHRLGLEALVLDHRTLDDVWDLRGSDRHGAPKPRCSASVIVGARARAAGDGVVLPALHDALQRSEDHRSRHRSRRRRALIAARVTVSVAAVGWIGVQALVPERPPAAVAATSWLPYAAPGVEGMFPRTWYVPQAAQAPVLDGARELVTITTVLTGDGRHDARCGALAAMGDADVLVAIYKTAGRRHRPERFTLRRSAALERELRRCHRGLRVSWERFDGRGALIVLGSRAGRDAETVALEILNRAHVR